MYFRYFDPIVFDELLMSFFSKFQISALNSSQFTELYIKGWYNEKNIINISEDNYQNNLEKKNSFLKNFNWLNKYWLSNNFSSASFCLS